MNSGAQLLDRPTLVLNRSWQPVFTVPVRRAIVWLYRDIAHVVHETDYTIHDLKSWADASRFLDKPFLASPSIRLAVPDVVKMVRYNGVPRFRVAFTRRALFVRDKYRCQYCGAAPGTRELTIDHVLPLSRGGRSTWENCVLACVRCNSRKGCRTPAEAGMTLLKEPREPNWSPLFNLSPTRVLDSWQNFISEAYWNVILRD